MQGKILSHPPTLLISINAGLEPAFVCPSMNTLSTVELYFKPLYNIVCIGGDTVIGRLWVERSSS